VSTQLQLTNISIPKTLICKKQNPQHSEIKDPIPVPTTLKRNLKHLMIYPLSLIVKSIILTVTQIKEGGNPNNSNKAA